MKTLILGHGRTYKKDLDTRCSPIDVDEWFNDPYDCVDEEEEVKPDFVFDLTKKWTFAPADSYDRIIDTTGGALQIECGIRSEVENIHAYSEGRRRSPSEYGHSGNRPVDPFILKQVQRILKPYGLFYPDWHYKNTIYQRDIVGELVLLKNKIVPQFLVPAVPEHKLNEIINYPLVINGTYTIQDYIESDICKAEHKKKMEKWNRYCCNICKTNLTTYENHQTHLASEQHKRQKSIKMIQYSCPVDDELLELYRLHKTKNICKIIQKEENRRICI
jgi:hypothetical protein